MITTLQSKTQPQTESKTHPNPRLALAALALSTLLSSAGTSMPNIALPTLAETFSLPLQKVQWVILAYLLAITLSIVGAGRLGDAIGRRNALLLGASTFAAAALLCGVAPGFKFLVSARALQGIAAAILTALSIATVSEVMPKEKLGRSMGLLGTLSAVGTASGPTLGGLLLSFGSWRSLFLALVPFGLISAFLIYHHLPKILPSRAPRIQWNLLRNPDILKNIIMNALVSCVMMSTLVVGPFYLSNGIRLAPVSIGLLMSVGPFTSILSGFPAGRLVDRFNSKRITIFGLIQLGIGTVGMATLPPHFGALGYLISAILMSPGYQMFQAANNAGIMTQVDPGQRGLVSGILGLSRNLGLIIGTAAMGAVFSHSVHAPEIATASVQAITHGMRVTFFVAGTLTLVALSLAISSLKTSPSV